MYFVMEPPIESDMGAGYCLVGELVYTISHPGVVPSLFDGREDESQWPGLVQDRSSSKFVNILSVVLWLLPAMAASGHSLTGSDHICFIVQNIDWMLLLHHHSVTRN